MPISGSSPNITTQPACLLPQRIRDFLCQIAGQEKPITYQALAKTLNLSPPNTIHQLTAALEHLIVEDAQTARPLIAALVISKARNGMPGPGFFDCARRVGRFKSEPSDPDGSVFYATEFRLADVFWSSTPEIREANTRG